MVVTRTSHSQQVKSGRGYGVADICVLHDVMLLS